MPKFDLFEHPIVLTPPKRLFWSTWAGHIPFGMFLIDQLRPRLFVELGTYGGTSYCSFCQAISELNIDATSFAIDTWKGDQHSGSYGEKIYLDLKEYHDPLYGSFSTLLPTTFDEASFSFDANSIDLLHIDGGHSYEEVNHDFNTWLPKMSNRGVILFHDICVTRDDFGVHQLWKEIKEDYRHFEFHHGFGLGLIVVGKESEESLSCLLDCNDEERRFIKETFGQLGGRLELKVENDKLTKELSMNMQNASILEKELLSYYELAQNPLVRLVRAWKRYGSFGLISHIARSLFEERSGSLDFEDQKSAN